MYGLGTRAYRGCMGLYQGIYRVEGGNYGTTSTLENPIENEMETGIVLKSGLEGVGPGGGNPRYKPGDTP